MITSSKVQQYFEECYKYYVLFEDNEISDYEFDSLCSELLENFNELPTYEQSLLDKGLLRAGSGYSISLQLYRVVGIHP